MFDAVVVGAGVSGLHAAYRLGQRGASVAVLEARQRIGGRLVSVEQAGVPLDLGATWVWPGERRVLGLIEELGLTTFAHFDAGDGCYDAPEGVQRVPAQAMGAGPSLRITGGSAALTDALRKRLDPEVVRTGSVVRRIVDQGQGKGQSQGLAVVTDDDTVVTRQVLLALPPALAVSSIDVDPPLPEAVAQLAANTPVWMGGIVKTVAVYERAFWRDAGFSGAAFSPRGPLQEIHDLSGPGGTPGALFGFTALREPGQRAPDRAAVLDQLGRMWGPAAATPLQLHVQDWSREAMTSPPGVALLTGYERFGHPLLTQPHLGGRLHFCSCEAHPGHGHIEDALAASERAVAAVT